MPIAVAYAQQISKLVLMTKASEQTTARIVTKDYLAHFVAL